MAPRRSLPQGAMGRLKSRYGDANLKVLKIDPPPPRAPASKPVAKPKAATKDAVAAAQPTKNGAVGVANPEQPIVPAPTPPVASQAAAPPEDVLPREIAYDLSPLGSRVFLPELPEKEIKREEGPLGGVMEEWDPYNESELAVIRQIKAWMTDEPGLFESASSDMLATFLRGYTPLINDRDHTFSRMHESLKWRKEEKVDTCLTDESWVSADVIRPFEEAFPCGPLGRDSHGHPVVLVTPGSSSSLMNKALNGMPFDDFLKCWVYNKEAERHYVASVSLKAQKRMYKVINVVDLSGFGMSHTKSKMIDWFKKYAMCFGLNYPEARTPRTVASRVRPRPPPSR
jgi:hypothetical protein